MITDKQKEFFEFLLNGVSKSDFTSNLESLVNEAKGDTELRKRFMDWETSMAYARHDGYEEGLEQGREEGAKQTAMDNARNFLKANVSPEVVSQCTGLSLETVLKLK